jgi:hypothetical protein
VMKKSKKKAKKKTSNVFSRRAAKRIVNEMAADHSAMQGTLLPGEECDAERKIIEDERKMLHAILDGKVKLV